MCVCFKMFVCVCVFQNVCVCVSKCLCVCASICLRVCVHSRKTLNFPLTLVKKASALTSWSDLLSVSDCFISSRWFQYEEEEAFCVARGWQADSPPEKGCRWSRKGDSCRNPCYPSVLSTLFSPALSPPPLTPWQPNISVLPSRS